MHYFRITKKASCETLEFPSYARLSRNSPLPSFPSSASRRPLPLRDKQRCVVRASGTHEDTFSCVSFSWKIDDDEKELTRISKGLYICRGSHTVVKPTKSQSGRRHRVKKKKKRRQKFKNIWGKCRRNSMRLYVPVSG